MLKKGILVSIIFTLSLFCIFSACKKQQPTVVKKITATTDAEFQPMEYVDENGNIAGFGIDMFKAIAKEGGFEVEFIKQPWEGIFDRLTAGQYDAIISSVTITDERKQTMDFSMPYVTCGQILVVKKDNNTVTKLSQLDGKKVGALRETTGVEEIKKNSKIIPKEYDEIGLAISDLANGRIDAVVCDSPIAGHYVLKDPKYNQLLKIAGDIFTTEQYGIAVKKGNTELLDLINNGLQKVQGKGIDKDLERKWLK